MLFFFKRQQLNCEVKNHSWLKVTFKWVQFGEKFPLLFFLPCFTCGLYLCFGVIAKQGGKKEHICGCGWWSWCRRRLRGWHAHKWATRRGRRSFFPKSLRLIYNSPCLWVFIHTRGTSEWGWRLIFSCGRRRRYCIIDPEHDIHVFEVPPSIGKITMMINTHVVCVPKRDHSMRLGVNFAHIGN